MSYLARLRQSFWFLPAVMCAIAVVLAESLIVLDEQLDEVDLGFLGVLVTRIGASGSRDLLGAVAGSMLTVAGTIFSITIAVLALTSSTYGPRLVRNFMADRGNQFVLGVFVSTFLYSLLVLRSIRVVDDDSGDYFVPHLAVNMAVLLAVLAIGVLVYFIHHISDSVQVATLAKSVRDDLVAAVHRLSPEEDDSEDGNRPGNRHQHLDIDHGDSGSAVAAAGDGGVDGGVDGARVTAGSSGYVQSIDHQRLLALAGTHDVVVELCVRTGHHLVEGDPLAVLRPTDRADDELESEVRKAVLTGPARTPVEDLELSVLLLEEMAVRALSPSMNDPYTAINALDDLSAGLVLFAGRKPPARRRYDEDGHLRVVTPTVVLTDLLDHVVDAMRLYAVGHPTVLHRTLRLVERVASASGQPEVRARMNEQVQRLVEAFELSSPQACDLTGLRRHADRVRQSLVAP